MIAWQIAASAISGVAAVGLGSAVSYRLLGYHSSANANAGNSRNESAHPGPSLDDASENSGGDLMDRFRPMARMLDAQELKFLASQPGYRPEMGARLQRSRRRIFRMYLGELSAEFERLHAAARRMATEAPEQHADLIPLLMRQQFAFWRSVAAIEMRLALSWAGFAPADASRLLEIVAELQQALAASAPASASATA